MTEPTITCPNCHTETRLTESLAATRQQYEQRLSQKDTEIAKREQSILEREKQTESEVRGSARKEAEESLKLKVMEKDQTIASMQQKIEELKQKAEQGSQQLQGEVQELELELESLLRAKFPFDSIEPVPKGEFGGDVSQRVTSPRAALPLATVLRHTLLQVHIARQPAEGQHTKTEFHSADLSQHGGWRSKQSDGISGAEELQNYDNCIPHPCRLQIAQR